MSDTPRPDPADAELVARLRSGESAAFEELVRTHTGRLLAAARRILLNEDDARDAVQECFLAAHRSLSGFSGQSRLSTWLHRIAVNAALMRLRSRRRHPEEPIDDLLPQFDDTGHHANPVADWREDALELLEKAELRATVRAAIDRLPESYRTVLLLRDIEELDTRETAERLGLSENAVKIRLHRARQALRTLLDPMFRKARLR